MITREEVLKALERITDPAGGKSVVASGMIEGLVVKDGHVAFAIEVDPKRGREAEPLRKQCEDAVNALKGVLSVTAVLTAHQGRKPEAPRPPQPAGIAGVANIVAVASGKGGVGKSTVAVNLAIALARQGLQVGLLDADIYGPSVPRLLAIRDKPRQGEAGKLIPIEKHGIKTMSIGFLVDEATPMIWRGPMVQSALTQMMNDVAWSPLDVLVVDMPPGTGDAQLTMAQRVPLKGAVIVSTPQDLALIDAKKAIAMFEKTQVPILGLVENMSLYVCPQCGHESHIFGHGGAKATAKAMGVAFLGEIPLVGRIREMSDAGTPVTATSPQSEEARTYYTVAAEVARTFAAPLRAAPKIVME
ncbi:MAG: iron-sulfur cluster carrier protein ApbC [Alphaproteobacteria bacterium]|nr:iron-sulfur cluster carrier protein ApbC [Alphaproteobacteria bacterium]